MKIKDNIADEFTEFSKNYTNDMIRCVPHYLKLVSGFTEALPTTFSPKNILDLGCGNGNITKNLLRVFPDAQITLLDASKEMLNLCRIRFNNYKIDYVASYFDDFDFKKNQYDMVVAGFSLHHCDANKKKELFKKIQYTLKTGGIFSCADLMINKENPEHPSLIKKWKRFVIENYSSNEKWIWIMEHYNEFDKPDNFKDQINWLEDAGFTNTEITYKKDYWIHLQAFKY